MSVIRRLGHVQPGRRDQRQALQALRIEDRELGCDPAAEREADEVDAVELERVEEVAVVQDEIVEAVEPLRKLRVPEARVLRGDQVDLLREPLVERQPHPRRARAMKEHNRLTRAFAAVGDLEIADLRRGSAPCRNGKILQLSLPSPSSLLRSSLANLWMAPYTVSLRATTRVYECLTLHYGSQYGPLVEPLFALRTPSNAREPQQSSWCERPSPRPTHSLPRRTELDDFSGSEAPTAPAVWTAGQLTSPYERENGGGN